MGELFAVLSGKGGTGKTSVCAGIATALAECGKKVLCIDCDVGLGNLDISLGVSAMGALTFADICGGNYCMQQALQHPEYPGLYLLAAPATGSVDQVDADLFRQLLHHGRQGYDFVLLDAPAGVEAGFRLAARFADRILLVAGPDPGSLRDAHRAAQLLEQMDKTQIRLVVNRISKGLARKVDLTVDDIMDKVGLPLIGVVPEDKNVTLAASCDQPLLSFTTKGAAAACSRIARRLCGYSVPIPL